MRRLGLLVLLTGCTEPDVQWYGFHVFLVLVLVWGAFKLWERRR